MFIKDKDITSYQLLLIKQDRVLVNRSTYFFDKSIWIFFFFLLFEKNGSVGRWETKHFIGMASAENKTHNCKLCTCKLSSTPSHLRIYFHRYVKFARQKFKHHKLLNLALYTFKNISLALRVMYCNYADFMWNL